MYKKFLPLIMMLCALLAACSNNKVEYLEINTIAYPDLDDDCIVFDDFYRQVADEFFDLEHYNDIKLYRHQDAAVVLLDFNKNSGYEDLLRANRFFHEMFISRCDETWVSVGKMSGFAKNIYDEDYKFWDEAYFIAKQDDKILYQSHFKKEENAKFVLSSEYINVDANDMFIFEKENLEKLDLESIEKLGKTSYYRSPNGNTLYIQIDSEMNEESLSTMAKTVDDVFNNLSEDAKTYCIGNYPRFIMRFQDDKGVYFEKEYLISF